MCLVRVEKIKIYFKFIKFIILSCEIGERMNVLTIDLPRRKIGIASYFES